MTFDLFSVRFMLKRWWAYLAAGLFGILLAFAVSTVAVAYDTVTAADKDAVSSLGDRELSKSEVEDAASLASDHDLVGWLIDEYGGSFGDWNAAEIEGEARGAFATLTLDRAIPSDPYGLRPDVTALKARYGTGKQGGHGEELDIDVDEGYPLQTIRLIAENVISYTVAVDLPTKTVISVMPTHNPPDEAPPLPQESKEPFVPVQPTGDESKGN